MFSSIRARTTAVFAIATTVLMALAIGGFMFYARRTAERNAADALSAGRAKISHELADDDEARNPVGLIDDEKEDLRPDDLWLFLTDANGRIVHASMKSPYPLPLTDPDLWRTTSIPVGEQSIVVALPWSKTESSLDSLARTLLLFGAFVVIVATVGAWMLVGRTLSPIGRLSSQANTATVDNLRVRLEEPSQDAEIVGLVETLNGLLSRLSETASAKGRFYSAASHELRTPLQALSGHLELALTRDRTQGEYRAAVEEAYRQTQRLTKLTKHLLLLYQLDSSASTLPDEPGNLATICRECVSQFRPLAEERGLRISADIPESAPFSAPATHAEVLVRNLIENAVRYATGRGEVRLTLAVLPDGLDLSVFNECALPPDWDPDRLFEPFVRPDASRSAATGGTGLGLTICKSIADANGWKLSIAGEANGLLASLSIPDSSSR